MNQETERSARQKQGSDPTTSVAELKQIVQQFVDQRNWRQFHSPKNLSMALAIEVGELMEHFQWISTEKSRELSEDSSKKEQVAEEVSDVFCYLLGLANELEIDLTDALQKKMVKNRQKYPAEEYYGKYGPEDV